MFCIVKSHTTLQFFAGMLVVHSRVKCDCKIACVMTERKYWSQTMHRHAVPAVCGLVFHECFFLSSMRRWKIVRRQFETPEVCPQHVTLA